MRFMKDLVEDPDMKLLDKVFSLLCLVYTHTHTHNNFRYLNEIIKMPKVKLRNVY